MSPETVDHVETKFFGEIETQAGPILEKLIAGGAASLSIADRYWWSLYLNASKVRVPHIVQRVRHDADLKIRTALTANPEEYLAIKGDAPEGTLLDYAERHAPARLANSGISVVVGLIQETRVIDRIAQLSWIVREVTGNTPSFMIGDDPFGRVGDLFKPRTLISIPLSPRHAFFGTDAADIIGRISTMRSDDLVAASNVTTLRSAKRFAYGDADPNFIDQYLLNDSPSGVAE